MFLCYDVNIDSDQTSDSTDEIDEIKWAGPLGIERIRLGIPNYAQPCIGWFEWRAHVIEISRPITKSDTYHVYSVNRQSKNIGQ